MKLETGQHSWEQLQTTEQSPHLEESVSLTQGLNLAMQEEPVWRVNTDKPANLLLFYKATKQKR